MRNAILPKVPPLLYNFGNNEAQIPNMNVSLGMDFNVGIHGSRFSLESKVFNDDNRRADFSIPYQSIINFQPGYQSTSSASTIISQQSMLLSKKVSGPDIDMDSEAVKMRKRSFTAASLPPHKDITDFVENKKSILIDWRNNKRKKTALSEEKNQIRDSFSIHEHLMPVRKSQKLSDKITALQKLVSPYGKTDTASVLQEASVYIKLLHEQIQKLLDGQRDLSNNNVDRKLADLQSRGFCLVPISIMQKITQKEHVFYPNVYSG